MGRRSDDGPAAVILRRSATPRFEHNDTVEWNHGDRRRSSRPARGRLVHERDAAARSSRWCERPTLRSCSGGPSRWSTGRPGLAHPAGRCPQIPLSFSLDRGEEPEASSPVGSTLVPYVFSFDHKHRRPRWR